MKRGQIFTLTILLALSSQLFGQASDGTLIFGLKGSEIFKASAYDDYSQSDTFTPKYLKAKLKPSLQIRFEGQTFITIRPTVIGTNRYGTPIASNFYFTETADQENFLQLGEHDFDKDGINEIVIAYGVRGAALKCYVLKYHEPAHLADASRHENWEVVGDFEYAYHDPRYISVVEDNKMRFPFGSQGASESFVFVDGRFVKF